MTAPHEADEPLELLARNRRILDKHLQVGDTLTHNGTLGCLEEHIFSHRDGLWLLSHPTAETRGFTGEAVAALKPISPLNVTHLNRVPLDQVPALELIGEIQKRTQSNGSGPLNSF